MQKSTLLIFSLSFLLSSLVFAQRSRVNYVDLVNRTSIPQIFFDDLIFPTEEGKTEIATIFRFDNDFLPFKKITTDLRNSAPEWAEYYTIIQLNKEVFKGSTSRRGKNKDLIDVASRDMWIDTLYTSSFEDTEVNTLFASGSLSTEIDAGKYNTVLQLSLIENTNDRNSTNRNFIIPDWSTKKTGEIYFIQPEASDTMKLPLVNMGKKVLYGEDFQSLIRIPNYSTENKYTVRIHKMNLGRKDTTKGDSIYEYVIDHDDIIQDMRPQLNDGSQPSISFVESDLEFVYTLVKIPHSSFQNASYSIELTSDDEELTLSKNMFQSYWPDMPASLLNLDIAIEHMKFFLKEDELGKINSGSTLEKEQKFRAFWDRLDPTPNTVLNERMAEYYRRIDYAFKQFGNRGNLAGHESDQGKVFINFGPADEIDRQFPTNGKVIEIWKYGSKNFIFEASSGFGDFILIGTE